MQRVDELFEVRYGHSLELNALKQVPLNQGIAFVSRKMGDNGISAYVERIPEVDPAPIGELTCALGGNGVLSTFIQEVPFYSGRDVAHLNPKVSMTKQQLLFYCMCIKANRFRYSYGRQANKTLKSILIPPLNEIPEWVNEADLFQFKDAKKSLLFNNPDRLQPKSWNLFELQELFDIERGKGPRKQELDGIGTIPVVTSTDQNNGWTGVTRHKSTHAGNTIGVNRNGSVGEAFYQSVPFCSTEDVHVFSPKFNLNKYIGLFLSTIIRKEKYRFNYGRKWGINRMKETRIKLPVDKSGNPDWQFMEDYIKSLPFSSTI